MIYAHKTLFVSALLTATLFGAASNSALGNIYFPNDATINSDVFLPVVGYANHDDLAANPRRNSTSPTINVVVGGRMRDNSYAYNSSTINFRGGSVDYLYTHDSTTINVSSGNVGNLFAYDSTTINITGGSVGGELNAYNSSTVNFSGGSLGLFLIAHDSSTVNFSSGSINSLLDYSSGTVNVSGGYIGGYLTAAWSSTVNLSGGSIHDDLYVDDSGTLNIFGSGLTATLVNPNYLNGSYSLYSLSGTLRDGTVLTNKNLRVRNGTGASFHINPSTLVTVSGTIALQSALNSAQPLSFTFRPTTGSAFTRTITPNSAGSYSFLDIPSGLYTVSIKGTKWLRKNISVDARNGNVTNAIATLLAGDANNDNFADIADLLLLIAHYNQVSPNAGFSDAADLNCDGVNDITDLLLLVANYNKQGDS